MHFRQDSCRQTGDLWTEYLRSVNKVERSNKLFVFFLLFTLTGNRNIEESDSVYATVLPLFQPGQDRVDHAGKCFGSQSFSRQECVAPHF